VKSPSQALRSARLYPFAAPADVVTGIHPGKPNATVLLLPSLRSAPLDSPELIRITPRPAPQTDRALLPWTVPVVSSMLPRRECPERTRREYPVRRFHRLPHRAGGLRA
jgi:hypothetical protein